MAYQALQNVAPSRPLVPFRALLPPAVLASGYADTLSPLSCPFDILFTAIEKSFSCFFPEHSFFKVTSLVRLS